MFFTLVSVTFLALFFCTAIAEDEIDNVSPTDSKIQHKRYFTELKNTELSGNVAVLKNVGTGMMNFFKDVLETKERKNVDNSSTSLKEINGRSNKILGSIVDFVKTTGSFISKAFNCIKSQNNIERNETVEALQKLSTEKTPNQHVNITVNRDRSKTLHIDSRHKYDDKNVQLNKAYPSKELPYGKLDDSVTVQNSSNESNIYKKKHFLLENFKSKTEPPTHSVSYSNSKDKLFEDLQISNTPKNTPRTKYEFIVETSTKKQLNLMWYKVPEETSLKQNHRIRFMTHSEEYQKLWKPVLKMNKEERRARLAKKYLFGESTHGNDVFDLNGTTKNSNDKLITHSEEYRTKWQPLIALNNHLKPGRRLHPGRSFKRTTEKSVQHEGVEESTAKTQSDEVLREDVTEKCKLDFQNKSVNGAVSVNKSATLNSIVITSNPTTLSADKSALENKKNGFVLEKVENITCSEKERGKFEEDPISTLAAEVSRPWAENRFQRVSNNIGLDQHFKTSGSKWGRAVSRLTARPNNSRVTYDAMFPQY